MSGSSASALAQRIALELDPRVVPTFLAAYGRADPCAPVPLTGHVVLVGHRAAGKTRLLPLIAELTGRPGIDLDAEIARRAGRPLREWVQADPASFRQAERETFAALGGQAVVAAGGGFLSLHADLLAGHLPVLIPVTFETYRERLLADPTRPRLRPELSPEEELRSVFEERERRHATTPALPLAAFVRAMVGA